MGDEADKRERDYRSRLEAVRRGLVGQGYHQLAVDAALTDWEVIAPSFDVTRDQPAYWAELDIWIVGRLGFPPKDRPRDATS